MKLWLNVCLNCRSYSIVNVCDKKKKMQKAVLRFYQQPFHWVIISSFGYDPLIRFCQRSAVYHDVPVLFS